MQPPENRFSWNYDLNSDSIINSSNYNSYQINSNPETDNLVNYRLNNHDADEFFICGTSITFRGENSKFKPECVGDVSNEITSNNIGYNNITDNIDIMNSASSRNDIIANNITDTVGGINNNLIYNELLTPVAIAAKEVAQAAALNQSTYEKTIGQLKEEIKSLKNQLDHYPILEDNLRILYEENEKLRKLYEVEKYHRMNTTWNETNNNNCINNEDELDEIIEELEVHNLKRQPTSHLYNNTNNNDNNTISRTDQIMQCGNNINKRTVAVGDQTNYRDYHFIDLKNQNIDETQFPSYYWSRLESFFYKRFLSNLPSTREIGIQLTSPNKRTTATMVSPIDSSKFKCFGVSVYPSSKDIGIMCDKIETNHIGCNTIHNDIIKTDWLINTFPNIDENNCKIIHHLISTFNNNQEEFVKLLYNLIKKSTKTIGIQIQPSTCSHSSMSGSLIDTKSKQTMSEYVQALPLCYSRNTMTKIPSGINVACLTETPVLRSQGTFIQPVLPNLTTTGMQTDYCDNNVNKNFLLTNSHSNEDGRISLDNLLLNEIDKSKSPTNHENIQSTSEKETKNIKNKKPLRSLIKKERSVEITMETTNTHTTHRERRNSSSGSRMYPSSQSTPKSFNTSNLSPKRSSSAPRAPESYTICTEKRIVDELSQRRLLLDKVNIEDLKKSDQSAFQDAVSRGIDLGTTHVVKEFQPSTEVLHHIGDRTEEVDISTLPDEVLSPHRMTSPSGSYASPDFVFKYGTYSRPNSAFSGRSSHVFTSSPPIPKTTPTDKKSDEFFTIPVICGEKLIHTHIPETTHATDIPMPPNSSHISKLTSTWIPVRNHKYTLPPEARTACESLIGFYQAERTHGRQEAVKDKFLTIVKIWFDLAASAQTDLLNIEDFMAILYDYSPQLLYDVIQSIDENQSTCLHYAVGHGAWQVVNLILDTGYAHPDQFNRFGFSALMIATLSNASDPYAMNTLHRLFSLGNTNLRTNTSARQTPLMLASLHGASEICKLLIAHGADINAQDASGNTALMCAIEQGHIDVIKCLIEYSDLNLQLKANDGQDALAVAQSKNNPFILSLIEEACRSSHQFTTTTEVHSGSRYHEKRTTHRVLEDLREIHVNKHIVQSPNSSKQN